MNIERHAKRTILHSLCLSSTGGHTLGRVRSGRTTLAIPLGHARGAGGRSLDRSQAPNKRLHAPGHGSTVRLRCPLVEEVVTERTRTEVWQGLWDVHRMVRYYQAAHGRYLLYNSVSMCALMIFGAIALMATWEPIPDIVLPVAGLLTAGIVLWILFAGYAAKSAVAHTISSRCADLAIEWSTLSARVDNPEADINEQLARRLLDDLKRRMLSLTWRQTTRQAGNGSGHGRLHGKLHMKDFPEGSTKPARPPGSKPPPPPPPPRRPPLEKRPPPDKRG